MVWWGISCAAGLAQNIGGSLTAFVQKFQQGGARADGL